MIRENILLTTGSSVIPLQFEQLRPHVRFEVFTAVTMQNIFFWGIARCGSTRCYTPVKTSFNSLGGILSKPEALHFLCFLELF
jgi:hypothetical protein